MKVIITARKKTDHENLSKYPPYILKIFRHLSRIYKIKIPEEIILRPVRKNYNPYAQSFTYGKAGHDGKKYWIAMNTELDSAFNTLSHEIAHIVEAMKYKKWSHSKKFQEINERALEMVE